MTSRSYDPGAEKLVNIRLKQHVFQIAHTLVSQPPIKELNPTVRGEFQNGINSGYTINTREDRIKAIEDRPCKL